MAVRLKWSFIFVYSKELQWSSYGGPCRRFPRLYCGRIDFSLLQTSFICRKRYWKRWFVHSWVIYLIYYLFRNLRFYEWPIISDSCPRYKRTAKIKHFWFCLRVFRTTNRRTNCGKKYSGYSLSERTKLDVEYCF